jgi:hypothetical protein
LQKQKREKKLRRSKNNIKLIILIKRPVITGLFYGQPITRSRAVLAEI